MKETTIMIVMRQQQPNDFQAAYLIQLWSIYQERCPGTRVFLFQEEETLK